MFCLQMGWVFSLAANLKGFFSLSPFVSLLLQVVINSSSRVEEGVRLEILSKSVAETISSNYFGSEHRLSVGPDKRSRSRTPTL